MTERELVRALVAARIKAGLSQTAVARLAGVSARLVSHWEAFERPMSLGVAVLYAEAVGVVLWAGAA